MSEDRRLISSEKYFGDLDWHNKQFVGPGEFFTSDDPDVMIVAETSDGVIIAIYDPEVSIGGLTHILLPKNLLDNFKDLQKVGDDELNPIIDPLTRLVEELYEKGAGKEQLFVRLVGGSSIRQDVLDTNIKNIVFYQKQIFERGLKIITRDIGGDHCRRIHFMPTNGRIDKYPLRRNADRDALQAREREFLDKYY